MATVDVKGTKRLAPTWTSHKFSSNNNKY